MKWYYADGGRQLGPVEETDLDNLALQGAVRDDTLVWREGMEGWQPYASARGPRTSAASGPAAVVGAAVAAPAYSPSAQPAEMRYCSECGRPFPAQELSAAGNAFVCGQCRPTVMQRMASGQYPGTPMPGAPGVGALPSGGSFGGASYGGSVGVPMGVQAGYPATTRFAGFWIRFLARLIDFIIIGCVTFIIRLPLTLLFGVGAAGLRVNNDPAAALAALPFLAGFIGISFLIQVGVSLLYEVYFVSSRGATPGKIALGLKIIRADGGPVGAGLAAGRYFAMWLSSIILWIGYIIAGFDSQKRALHDMICETRVVHVR